MLYLFTAWGACVLVFGDDIFQFPMTEFLLSKASIIFPHRLQILLRSEHKYTAVLRQVCLILTSIHAEHGFQSQLIKSFFLFNHKVEASLNWSGASLVEATLCKQADPCNV